MYHQLDTGTLTGSDNDINDDGGNNNAADESDDGEGNNDVNDTDDGDVFSPSDKVILMMTMTMKMTKLMVMVMTKLVLMVV